MNSISSSLRGVTSSPVLSGALLPGGNSGVVGPAYPHRPVDSFEQLSQPEVRAAIQGEVLSFLQSDHAPAVKAPANFELFASTDVTPRYERDVNYKAFDINGELMLELVPHGDTRRAPTWYDLGTLDHALQATA